MWSIPTLAAVGGLGLKDNTCSDGSGEQNKCSEGTYVAGNECTNGSGVDNNCNSGSTYHLE